MEGDTVKDHCESVTCNSCGRELIFIRNRDFSDGSGRVFMCENPKCDSWQYYVYPEPPTCD